MPSSKTIRARLRPCTGSGCRRRLNIEDRTAWREFTENRRPLVDEPDILLGQCRCTSSQAAQRRPAARDRPRRRARRMRQISWHVRWRPYHLFEIIQFLQAIEPNGEPFIEAPDDVPDHTADGQTRSNIRLYV